MSDSVAAATKLNELRTIVQAWAERNSIDVEGQQLFPNIRIEVGLHFARTQGPMIEVHENTAYKKEWQAVENAMRKGTPKIILFKFIGRENAPVPLWELGDISNPRDMVYLINAQLLKIYHPPLAPFSWRMEYEDQIFRLITNPVR